MRIRPDGSAPPDNPFVSRAGALPEIWSYGHRNMQGAALHPRTGRLWTHEHGAARRRRDQHPAGRQELRLAGDHLRHRLLRRARSASARQGDGMEQPIHYWDPSIAPSGMAFYTGDLFPGLARQPVRRRARRPAAGAARARRRQGGEGGAPAAATWASASATCAPGPDGALWLLTDATNGASCG